MAAVEAQTLAPALRDPGKIDLFEDGAAQALRALSAERLEYIAALVACGLTSDERKEIEAKQLLKLLDELDDDQVVILQSKLHRHMSSKEFYERHQNVLEPVVAHLQSPRGDLDREALYRLARRQLVDLGLLRQTFRKPRKGEVPEFDDKTGTMKSHGTELRPLGRLLLRLIGLAEEAQMAPAPPLRCDCSFLPRLQRETRIDPDSRCGQFAYPIVHKAEAAECFAVIGPPESIHQSVYFEVPAISWSNILIQIVNELTYGLPPAFLHAALNTVLAVLIQRLM